MFSLFRIIRLAIQDIVRNFWLSLVTVTMMVLALLSLNLLIAVHMLSNEAVHQFQEQLNVQITLRRDAAPGAIEQLRAKIVDLPEVKEVIHQSKEDLYAEFKERYKDNRVLERTFQSLERNPLGDVLSIRLQDGQNYQGLFGKVRASDADKIIEEEFFQDYEEIIGRLEQVTRVIRQIGIGLIVLFGFIAALVIVNTLRVAIYTHREEIAVMKLVGATDQFIQAPFLAGVIVLGTVSLLIAIILLSLLFGFFQPFLHSVFSGAEIQLLNYYETYGWRLFVEQYLGIVGLSLVAAWLAIRRYARV